MSSHPGYTRRMATGTTESSGTERQILDAAGQIIATEDFDALFLGPYPTKSV